MSEQEPTESPQYELDDETQSLIEVALNCLMTLADALGIVQLELEQDTTDSGEVIYKPKGGIFPNEDS